LPPARHENLNDFRVLVIDSHPLCPTSSNITNAIGKLVDRLINFGVKISHNTPSVPNLAEITRTYVSLLAAFISGNMPIDEYQKIETAAKLLHESDVSLEACFMRGCILNYRDWFMKTRTRGALRQQWRNLFKEFDVVICPVMPTPAFPHDHSDPDKRQIEIDGLLFPYNDQYAWVSIATLFGLPATVVPIGHTENGLPIGVQVIGDYLEDYTTIKFGELIERELGGFTAPSL
jgi:amidase